MSQLWKETWFQTGKLHGWTEALLKRGFSLSFPFPQMPDYWLTARQCLRLEPLHHPVCWNTSLDYDYSITLQEQRLAVIGTINCEKCTVLREKKKGYVRAALVSSPQQGRWRQIGDLKFALRYFSCPVCVNSLIGRGPFAGQTPASVT